MVLLGEGAADGAALVQLHLSLVEVLLQSGGGALSAMLGLMSTPAAPFPLAGSTSACPESPAMWLGELDFGWVSLASASGLFPSSCSLSWQSKCC